MITRQTECAAGHQLANHQIMMFSSTFTRQSMLSTVIWFGNRLLVTVKCQLRNAVIEWNPCHRFELVMSVISKTNSNCFVFKKEFLRFSQAFSIFSDCKLMRNFLLPLAMGAAINLTSKFSLNSLSTRKVWNTIPEVNVKGTHTHSYRETRVCILV